MEILRGAMGLPIRRLSHRPPVEGNQLRRMGGPDLARDRSPRPQVYARRQADRWNVAAPGGGSYRDLYQGVVEWIESVRSDTVAVAHYGTARCIRAHFLKLSRPRCSILTRLKIRCS